MRVLADKLTHHHNNVCIAQVAGSSASLAGFGFMAAGFGFSFLTGGLSLILAGAGAVVSVAGGLPMEDLQSRKIASKRKLSIIFRKSLKRIVRH